jgi:hypothetical protein
MSIVQGSDSARSFVHTCISLQKRMLHEMEDKRLTLDDEWYQLRLFCYLLFYQQVLFLVLFFTHYLLRTLFFFPFFFFVIGAVSRDNTSLVLRFWFFYVRWFFWTTDYKCECLKPGGFSRFFGPVTEHQLFITVFLIVTLNSSQTRQKYKPLHNSQRSVVFKTLEVR